MHKMRDLSPRQRQIAERIFDGKSNKQIAYELSLSVSTIEFYIRALLKKTNCKNRTHFIVQLKEEKKS